MSPWLSEMLEKSNYFMPHGHCYLWIPGLLWTHVISDLLIGAAYLGISIILYVLVRKIRLPFSPVFIAFGLFIGLCGLTHFMEVWTVWNPDYWVDGLLKVGTAAASVATAVGLLFVKPQVEEVVNAARLSEERRIRLESTNAELEALYKKIKGLDELKTQFFANVSHELRTPLALVLGPAEHMLRDDNLTPEQRRQLESISRNGKNLLKQVNDLLDVAKLEAGKMQIHYARLDLAPWFRRTASQFEVAAEQRQIRFQVSAPDTLPAEVDPDMLERIFVNLLSNAFKFTPRGGEVHVELESGKDEFCFSVADTGPGIQADQREAVFERFRQIDGGATRNRGGTGLGLAIVKDFVDLHDGKVEVTSTTGGGAKFVVRLPLLAPASVEIADPADPPHVLQSTTPVAIEGTLRELAEETGRTATGLPLPYFPNRPSVLVVEDNREMSDFVAGTLAGEYNVITASNGQDGYERALVLQPDLIVTDIMMPGVSGDQLVGMLRSHSEFNNLPILLLTAKADDELRVRLLQSGAQDYLTKPFLPQELQARAKNLIVMKRAGDTLRDELAGVAGNVEDLAKELSVKHRQLQTALDATDVAREQAERASQVKTLFLSMVSHELRTPLSTIHMNVQLLARHREDQSMDAINLRSGRLARATQQMTTLIEGLLEYTRVESGKVDARLETVNAAAIAQEVVQALEESSSPSVKLVLEHPAADFPTIESDPRLLRVVLSNLVSNALKFTKQGTVTIRLGIDNRYHVFEVHDTGIGISEADIPRAFLPFEQIEPVQRKSIPGVGLGLALVKQIVDAMGGRIEVTSEVDVGTRFRVLFLSRSLEAAEA